MAPLSGLMSIFSTAFTFIRDGSSAMPANRCGVLVWVRLQARAVRVKAGWPHNACAVTVPIATFLSRPVLGLLLLPCLREWRNALRGLAGLGVSLAFAMHVPALHPQATIWTAMAA